MPLQLHSASLLYIALSLRHPRDRRRRAAPQAKWERLRQPPGECQCRLMAMLLAHGAHKEDAMVTIKEHLRALAQGVSLRHVLADVKRFRETDDKTPGVLMGYANPIERMGTEAFAKAAKEAGVDGVLVVDYPPEECVNFAEQMRSAGIDPIFLLAPTSTDERIAEVGKIASGYVYYVSLKGVTGAANLDVSSIASKIPAIKSRVPLPVGVGFGIRDAQTAKSVAEVSDAVVIGSRIVQLLEKAAPGEAAGMLTRFIAEIREALDSIGATAR